MAIAGEGGERKGEVRTRGSDGANGVEGTKGADMGGGGRGWPLRVGVVPV